MRIVKLNAIDSTNRFLKAMVKDLSPTEEVVVLAASQLEGKGQRGSAWFSEQGKSLTFSMLKLNNSLDVSSQFYISKAISIAIKVALEGFIKKDIKIKWPNDILSDNKKIVGILIENIVRDQVLTGSIIGVGLNVNNTLFENLPRASSMKLEAGKDFCLDQVLDAIILSINDYWNILKNNNFKDLDQQYEAALFRKDMVSTFKNEKGFFTGIIRGISSAGKLTVECKDGKIKAFGFQEVKLMY